MGNVPKELIETQQSTLVMRSSLMAVDCFVSNFLPSVFALLHLFIGSLHQQLIDLHISEAIHTGLHISEAVHAGLHISKAVHAGRYVSKSVHLGLHISKPVHLSKSDKLLFFISSLNYFVAFQL
ncbi:chromatin structure-remodeling complex protein SYD [Dorcoceras hygrometricum]|uniref:Chromatin structure-remodeling complex protein SYD n=1 Tax=Dorcoceras hygrometricum TaxID=472368 RepID=A0A2Z7AAP6_9LAMI|nr:chromatin structure-remodeling complex protein SYD [Dorcoceras hygrometricum]